MEITKIQYAGESILSIRISDEELEELKIALEDAVSASGPMESHYYVLDSFLDDIRNPRMR